MGFFSYDCLMCGHPMLSSFATNAINRWMNLVVAILPNGSILKGNYDGYGQVGNFEVNLADVEKRDDVGEHHGGPACYHKACWVVAGKPTTRQEESPSSLDQGWFFEDGKHDIPEPKDPPQGRKRSKDMSTRKPQTYSLQEAKLILQNMALRRALTAAENAWVSRIRSLESALKLAGKAHRARVTECKRLEEFVRSLGGKVNRFRDRLNLKRGEAGQRRHRAK